MSRNPEDLCPAVREKLEQLQAKASQNDIDFIVTYTLRTAEEQHALFAQGRKTLDEVNRLRHDAGLPPIDQAHNRIVTYLLVSIHMFNCAFDVAILDQRGHVDYLDTAAYETLGALGESIGLHWGGRWKSQDLCHFEYTGGLDMAALEKGERPTA